MSGPRIYSAEEVTAAQVRNLALFAEDGEEISSESSNYDNNKMVDAFIEPYV